MSLLSVFGICVGGIGLASMHPARNIFSDYNLLTCMATTTLLSLAAYWLTDKGILEFKDTLKAKNLFGKDLNKIGDHRDEAKEKM